MSNVKLLPLYAELQGHPKIEIIKRYARANVEANTEALWAEVHDVMNAALDKVIEFSAARHEAEARADRLAEALRDYFDDPHADAEATLRKLAALHPTAAQENDHA